MRDPGMIMRNFAATLLAAGLLVPTAMAQPAAPTAGRGGAARPAPVVSPEVLPDRRVIFRIAAPQAQTVTLNDIDTPGLTGAGVPVFQKNDAGVWEATVGPVNPGTRRYAFNVDGLRVLDPVNTQTSESNTLAWSVCYVPGEGFMETRDIPHGAIAQVFYASSVLKLTRRMHVYTPPGYEAGSQKYPVFYLLHGAQDTDDAWPSVGRAGFILDNLLATGKIKPMIVVMPAGHQPGTTGVSQPPAPPAVSPFTAEFMTDILPYVEKYYRTIPDRQHRAIAGLSMGGMQTLDIAFNHLDKFSQIGVFSSGATLGGARRGPTAPAAPAAAPATPPPARPDWEATHLADLDNASLKKGTKLLWLSTGVDDGLITSTRATVDILKKHGFAPVFKESPGAHTWINWRNYLNEFAPLLFQ